MPMSLLGLVSLLWRRSFGRLDLALRDRDPSAFSLIWCPLAVLLLLRRGLVLTCQQ